MIIKEDIQLINRYTYTSKSKNPNHNLCRKSKYVYISTGAIKCAHIPVVIVPKIKST